MSQMNTYTLDYYVKKAANDNFPSIRKKFGSYLKVSLFVAPVIAWLLWA